MSFAGRRQAQAGGKLGIRCGAKCVDVGEEVMRKLEFNRESILHWKDPVLADDTKYLAIV